MMENMKQLLASLAAATLLVGCNQQDQGGTGADSYQVPGSGTAADTGLGATTNQTGARTNQSAAPSGGTAVPQGTPPTP